MLKGRNVLVLNQATMKLAMQLWLEHEFKEPPAIDVVRYIPSGSHGEEFQIVTLGELPDHRK